MIDRTVDQVTTDGGPYPDAMTDKRTRYPVAEAVASANFEVNKGRLKHIFATCDTPRNRQRTTF